MRKKKKEVKNMQDRLDQLENATAKVKNKLDKMSLHFVIPLVSFYFIVGLLLILLNETVTHVAAWALAAGLILAGGWLLIRYLRADIRKRLAGADMALGLVLLLAGILLIASPTDMRDVFPKIWGLSLILGGFLNIQNIAAFVAHQHAHLLAPGPGLAGDLADCRDGGQGLSPEPQGLDPV